MPKKKEETTGLLMAVTPVTVREEKKKGGLLESDRQQYQIGSVVSKIARALKGGGRKKSSVSKAEEDEIGLRQAEEDAISGTGLGGATSRQVQEFEEAQARYLELGQSIEDYAKLTPEQRESRLFQVDEAGDWIMPHGHSEFQKDFDMLMMNAVLLDAEQRKVIKEMFPDFRGDTFADLYYHTGKDSASIARVYDKVEEDARMLRESTARVDDGEFDDDLPFAKGGLLSSDRQQYKESRVLEELVGGMPLAERKARPRAFHKRRSDRDAIKFLYDYIKENSPDKLDEYFQKSPHDIGRRLGEKEIEVELPSGTVLREGSLEREALQAGGMPPLPPEMMALPPPQEAMPPGDMPQEAMPQEAMLEDEQMEDEYLDFVVSESLNEEEENYLMNSLEADPQLSIIFDKIMDTATEFSGSGPVDGPGSEVSDSIPARLSDGEFVLTAKATEELGPDNVQAMMEGAEARSDERQIAQAGGIIRPDLKEGTNEEIRKGMLGTNPRLQQSG